MLRALALPDIWFEAKMESIKRGRHREYEDIFIILITQ